MIGGYMLNTWLSSQIADPLTSLDARYREIPCSIGGNILYFI
jgi:hypothetical protein